MFILWGFWAICGEYFRFCAWLYSLFFFYFFSVSVHEVVLFGCSIATITRKFIFADFLGVKVWVLHKNFPILIVLPCWKTWYHDERSTWWRVRCNNWMWWHQLANLSCSDRRLRRELSRSFSRFGSHLWYCQTNRGWKQHRQSPCTFWQLVRE